MENKEFEVNVDNVKECWKYYEEYMEEYRKTHYSDDVNYDEFVNWCENELFQCPNCDEILRKEDQEHLDNLNGVCDQCIINGYYS